MLLLLLLLLLLKRCVCMSVCTCVNCVGASILFFSVLIRIRIRCVKQCYCVYLC